MRIVSVVCALPPYKAGMGIVAFREACGLVREKKVEHVTLVTMDVQSQITFSASVAPETPPGVAIQRLPTWWRVGLAGTLRGLSAVIKNHDVVHLHYPFFGSNELVAFLAWWHRKPLVITYHMDVRRAGVWRVVFMLYQRCVTSWVLARACTVVSASFNYIAQSYAGRFFERHKNMCVEIPFGVDMDFFAPGAPDAAFKERAGIPAQDPYILFVGALDKAHYFKGVHVLLEAFALFAVKNPHHLVVVGDGNMRAEYERRARALAVFQKIHFVGSSSHNDLVKWYQNADFFTLPSLDTSEAFGLVLEEALACGIPCISSDLPGVRTLILRTDGGVVVETGNAQKLAHAFDVVMKRKIHEPQWGLNIRERAQKLFSQEQALTFLYEIYTRNCGAHQKK